MEAGDFSLLINRNMSFSFGFWFVLGIAVAGGLALLQYYYGNRRKEWWVYALLRFITYLSIFLLLINPEIEHTTYTVEKPSLVLAVDNSSSIAAFESDAQVVDLVEKLKSDKTLQEKFNISQYTFGEEFRRSDSLDFSENQTKIFEVFSNLKKLYKNTRVATVLLTDGNQTYGRDYEFEAKNYNRPILPVVIGDTTHYADIRIDQVNVNRYAYLNNKFPVEVFLNYEGDEAVTKRFRITRNGKSVYSERIDFDSDKNSFVLNVNLPADHAGVNTYQAEIESLPNEKNTDNNLYKFGVEVIDQQTKILLVSSFLHPDVGALKKAIERSKQREVELKYAGDKIDYSQYQLAILYQPDSGFKSVFEQLDNFGLNRFIITGSNTDYAFLNDVQEIFRKEISDDTEEFLPVFNNDYGTFQLEDIGFSDFPPLDDVFGSIEFEEPVQTILFQNINGFETKTPLLATSEVNTIRTGFLFGENSWTWRAKSYRDNESFERFDNFFHKLVQYLVSNKRRDRLDVDYKSFYNSGEKIRLKAEYFDANYEFDPRAKLYAELINEDTGEKQELPFVLKSNYYELNLSNFSPGAYSFSVRVEGTDFTVKGKFNIIEFDMEKQFLRANVEKLGAIATEKIYFPNAAEELIKDLTESDANKAIQKEQISQSSLIDWWYLLGIIILSLSAEWFLRKYRGLI